MVSIKSALSSAANSLQANSDSPTLDAEVLLSQALNKPRSYLRAWPELILTQTGYDAFTTMLHQRQNGSPIAYIVGRREFWSRDFIVTPDVLIPRPETECLIELSLALMPEDKKIKIIDLGTGSGAIAITLAAERPLAEIHATDISPTALQIAKLNADRHQTTNITFHQSDWFTNIPEIQYSLIISNPPYIAADDCHLQQGDVRFEPQTALVAGEQGLHDIRKIAESANYYLQRGGYLLIEHGYNQARQVQAIFTANHYQDIQTHVDFSGNARVTLGRKTLKA